MSRPQADTAQGKEANEPTHTPNIDKPEDFDQRNCAFPKSSHGQHPASEQQIDTTAPAAAPQPGFGAKTLGNELSENDASASEELEFGMNKGEAEDEYESAEEELIDLTGQLASGFESIHPQLAGLVLSKPELTSKSRQWRNSTKKRFGQRKKFGFVEQQKELLPPEVLRQVPSSRKTFSDSV